MSTNYYFRNKDKMTEIKNYNESISLKINEIIDLVKNIKEDEEFQEEIRYKLEEELLLHPSTYDIHIGQRAMGWMALFKVNEEIYATIDELKRWYLDNQDEYIIVNEYNEELNLDELEEELIKWKGKQRGDFLDKDGFCWMNGEFS